MTNICKIITLFVVALAIGNVVVSNKLSTQGKDLSKLTEAILSQQKDNSYMREEIAHNTALSQIEAKATNLGYVSISKPIALTAPAPVAYVPNLQQ